MDEAVDEAAALEASLVVDWAETSEDPSSKESTVKRARRHVRGQVIMR